MPMSNGVDLVFSPDRSLEIGGNGMKEVGCCTKPIEHLGCPLRARLVMYGWNDRLGNAHIEDLLMLMGWTTQAVS